MSDKPKQTAVVGAYIAALADGECCGPDEWNDCIQAVDDVSDWCKCCLATILILWMDDRLAAALKLAGRDAPPRQSVVSAELFGLASEMQPVVDELRRRMAITETRAEGEPDFWRCTQCGCFWRDNHDNTVSLANVNEKSCHGCEFNTAPNICEPIYRNPAVGRDAPEPAPLRALIERWRAFYAEHRYDNMDAAVAKQECANQLSAALDVLGREKERP